MWRAAFLCLALVAAVPLAIARTAEHADFWNGSEINWRDVRSGIYESSQTGKPVIMVFHATWCPSCRRYRAIFKDPGVVALSKNFVMVLVDVDKDKTVNGAFSPDGTYVPRTIFLSSQGDVLKKYVGKDKTYPHSLDVDSADELRALMAKAASDNSAPATPLPPETNL